MVTDIGWSKAEGVPAMFSYLDEHGATSFYYKNVDEFLLMAPTDHPIIKATTTALEKKWGSNPVLGAMKVKPEAQEWRGYTFIRDRPRRALTIYMNRYLEQAVARHIPEMLASPSGRPSASLPKGVAVKDILGALRLPPAETRKPHSSTRSRSSIKALWVTLPSRSRC